MKNYRKDLTKMMNLPGSQYDGMFFTIDEGKNIIKAEAHVKNWPVNVLTLEVESWNNRF